MQKLIVPIKGMHCKSCELLIEENLKRISGVQKVEVSHISGKAKMWCEGNTPSVKSISKAVEDAGYTLGQEDKKHWFSRNSKDYLNLLNAGAILLLLFFFGKMFGLGDFAGSIEQKSITMALIVGLVAGVSSCMALVGGLVLALSARHSELHPEASPLEKFRPHLFFNLGRIFGFALLGGLIGLIGGALQPSVKVMGILTLAVGGVMLLLGLKLIEIFPILQKVNIALPKFISKFFGIKQNEKEYSHKGAVVGGALTFFLPCGFTQAMQLYAISTGSFVSGALIMSLFALGTAPGLLSIGGLSSVFKGAKAKLFFSTAGLAVIALGIFNISNASQVVFPSGSGTTQTSKSDLSGLLVNGKQEIRMTQNGSGYSPNKFVVKKGVPVRWVIDSTSQYSCAAFISMPAYNISRALKSGENIIEFTPEKTGEIPFSCSMGMYRGKFIVVDGDGKGAQAEPAPTQADQNQLAGTCGGGGCGCGGSGNKFVAQEGEVQKQPVNDSNAQIIKTSYTYNEDIIPNSFSVKTGEPVRMEVDVKENGQGCMSTIMIPGLFNEPQFLQKGKIITMEFIPSEKGEYPITCAMGVKRGVLKVN